MPSSYIPATVALMLLAAPASTSAASPPVVSQATSAPPEAAPVIRAEDEALSCAQIADEAATLSQTMGGEPDGGVFGSLGGVARAGAAALIPGAGLLIAGADALTGSERERREAEARAVQNRWYYLNGLYAGRRCLQDPTEARSDTAADPVGEAPPLVTVSR
jgi:hypothetical protein